MPACRPVCLPACQHASLPAFLPFCLPACPPPRCSNSSIPAYLPPCLPAGLPAFLLAGWPACRPSSQSACLRDAISFSSSDLPACNLRGPQGGLRGPQEASGSIQGHQPSRKWTDGRNYPLCHVSGSLNVYSRAEGIADHYWPRFSSLPS